MTRWLLALLFVGGCAGSGGREAILHVYDLGTDPPAAGFSGLRALPVRAAAPFDTSDMLYRLAFRNSAELLSFSQSRWAATPATLLQRRFARASGDGAAKCAIEFEVTELTQVFASAAQSEIVLEGRAVIFSGANRLGERSLRIREGNAGGNAASGAAATARAADRLIGEIGSWAAAIKACKPG